MTGPMVQGGLRDGHMTIPLLFAPPRLEIFIPRVAARTWPSATMIHSKAVPFEGSAKPCDRASRVWPG